MWEIYKSGSVRGIEVGFSRFKYCGTPHTERVEKRRKQTKSKGRKPYYVYSTRL